MIYRSQSQDQRTIDLENKVKESIKIPNELKDVMKFTTTSLGGLFLNYWSNLKKGGYKENSKKYFVINLHLELKYSSYVGDIGTMEMYQLRDLPLLRGFKKPVEAEKIIKRVNDYIQKNKQLLIDAIEN